MAHAVAVCGRQLIADKSGVLCWPSQGILLVADLLAGDGAAGSAQGQRQHPALPSPSLRPRLVRLAEAMDRYDPARVIALGHRGDIWGTAARMTADEPEIVRIRHACFVGNGRRLVMPASAPHGLS